MKEIDDKEIVNWLCNHTTFIIVINDDGREEAIKIAGEDICARDILINKVRG